jgi:hypothetical protein
MNLTDELKRQNALPPTAPGSPLSARAQTELAALTGQTGPTGHALSAPAERRRPARGRVPRLVTAGALAAAVVIGAAAGVAIWQPRPGTVTPSAAPTGAAPTEVTPSAELPAEAALLPSVTGPIDLAQGLDPAAGDYSLDPDFSYTDRTDVALFALRTAGDHAAWILRAVAPDTGQILWTLDPRDYTGLGRVDVATAFVTDGQVALLAGDSERYGETSGLWLLVADVMSGTVTAQGAVAWDDFTVGPEPPGGLVWRLAWADGVIVWGLLGGGDSTRITAVRADDPATVVWRSSAPVGQEHILSLQYRWVLTDGGYVNAADGSPAPFGQALDDATGDGPYTTYEMWATYRDGAESTTVFRVTRTTGGTVGFEPWDTAADGPLWAAPVTSDELVAANGLVVGDVVVVLESPPSEMGAAVVPEATRLSAYSLATGELLWARDAGDETGSSGLFLGGPLGEDRVWTGTSIESSGAGTVYHVTDVATGDPLATHTAPGSNRLFDVWYERDGQLVTVYAGHTAKDDSPVLDILSTLYPAAKDPYSFLTDTTVGPVDRPEAYYLVNSPPTWLPFKVYLAPGQAPVTFGGPDGDGTLNCPAGPCADAAQTTQVGFIVFP